jgi:hypothetical protein
MELTEEQIRFLDEVCNGRKHWKLNSNGEVDVNSSVVMNSMGLTEIPVKFGVVKGVFYCYDNKLTTLKNCPNVIKGYFQCGWNDLTSIDFTPTSFSGKESFIGISNNNLTDYFKNLKEEDFKYWDKLDWEWSAGILKEYPFLINIGKKYLSKRKLRLILNGYPLLKLYLE